MSNRCLFLSASFSPSLDRKQGSNSNFSIHRAAWNPSEPLNQQDEWQAGRTKQGAASPSPQGWSGEQDGAGKRWEAVASTLVRKMEKKELFSALSPE